MRIKVLGINGGILRTFDHVTDYDLTKYPIIELASEVYRCRVILKVPDGYYISVLIDDGEEVVLNERYEQNKS